MCVASGVPAGWGSEISSVNYPRWLLINWPEFITLQRLIHHRLATVDTMSSCRTLLLLSVLCPPSLSSPLLGDSSSHSYRSSMKHCPINDTNFPKFRLFAHWPIALFYFSPSRYVTPPSALASQPSGRKTSSRRMSDSGDSGDLQGSWRLISDYISSRSPSELETKAMRRFAKISQSRRRPLIG